MPGLDWGALDAAEVHRNPFDHILIAQALDPVCRAALADEFPSIRSPGSFALSDAPPGPALAGLIEDLASARFRARIGALFDLDLAGRPMVVTLRGQAARRDGRIHTDSRSKLISLLLYLNADWTCPEGRLRLLRGGRDLSDYAVEVPAAMGTLLAFRRSDSSWHGHTPVVGQRRVLQLNYLRSEHDSLAAGLRRRFSALTKRRAA